MTVAVNAFTTRIAPISFKRHEQARVARIVKQPPQFGIGQHAAAPKDASALAAVRALQGAQFERTEHLARYGDRYTVARQKKSQPVLATPLGHSSTN